MTKDKRSRRGGTSAGTGGSLRKYRLFQRRWERMRKHQTSEVMIYGRRWKTVSTLGNVRFVVAEIK